MGELRKLDKPVKRVIIAGGGNIGMRLAHAIEGRFQVKLIEHNPETHPAHRPRSGQDASCSWAMRPTRNCCWRRTSRIPMSSAPLTNDEEANILSAMLAKRLGARKVMSLINRASYVDLVQSGTIDIAISPQQATIGSLLTHVRRGDVVVVHSLRRGAAEAIEAVAHGDARTSKVVGRTIDEIKLPPGTTIGAMVRGEEVIIAHHDTVIESDDHVILFLVDKRTFRKSNACSRSG